MKKAGIIGLGTITKYYLKGLEESKVLKLVATCDVLEQAVSRSYFSEYPFYLDYKEMIEVEDLDYVVISTPPASHYEIASYALEHGVNVIVEKPAVLDLDKYEELVELARSQGRIFEVMYHWQNGSEVLGFNEHFDTSKISEIHVTVLDPYSQDAVTINDDKVKLSGAWVDSGVNSLSMIKMWLDFEALEVIDTNIQKCEKTGLPIYADVELLIDGVKAFITVDWRKHINHKESWVILDGEKIEIRHSDQSIVREVLEMKYDDMERLQHHYYNYFSRYDENVDVEASYRIHKVLLDVNTVL